MKSLKIPIVASLVLLALGAVIAWKNHQLLATAKINQNQLITELTNSGFLIDQSHPEKGAHQIKRSRENKEKNTIHLNNPTHLADLIQKIIVASKQDLQSDPEIEAPMDELEKNFRDLNFEDWRILFAQLRTNQDFEKIGANNIVLDKILNILYDSLYSLPENNLLQLASEFPELFKDNISGRTFIGNTLSGLLEKDSDAAIAWIQQNHLKFPGFVNGPGFACSFISSLAAKNPTQSFELISELAIKDSNYAIQVSALDLKSNEQRKSFLNALLKYNFLPPEYQTRNEAIDTYKSCLASSALNQGFDISTQWLIIKENQPKDWTSLIENIGGHTKATNFEKWAEWIEKNLPPEDINSGTHTLITNWTKKDYREAGEWLVKTSESPTKNAAIRAYAETIAAHEPATAAQWADKLPLGEPRDQTLNIIYNKWPKTDLVGKDAFGKLHHLK